MIPIQDVIPTRIRPWGTITLIAVMTVVLAIELIRPAAEVRAFIVAYGVTPLVGNWVMLPVSCLVHAGLVHGASNLVVLWLFGDALEDRLGHDRFLALYAVAAITSAAAVAWLRPTSSVAILGATGSVGALVGAYLVLFPRSRILVLVPLPFFFELVEIPAAIVPAFWALLQVIGTAHGGQSPALVATQELWTMLAGAVTGAALVRWLVRPERVRVEWWNREARG